MDGAGQAVARGWIMNGIIAKRHIADNGIKIVVGKLCFFKALRKYRSIRVEFLGNPGRERVKFNTCPVASAHRFRHEPEKMPDPHSWLKYFHSLPYTEFFQSIPDRATNKRGGK